MFTDAGALREMDAAHNPESIALRKNEERVAFSLKNFAQERDAHEMPLGDASEDSPELDSLSAMTISNRVDFFGFMLARVEALEAEVRELKKSR